MSRVILKNFTFFFNIATIQIFNKKLFDNIVFFVNITAFVTQDVN